MPGSSDSSSARGTDVSVKVGTPSLISTVLVLAWMADGATGAALPGCRSVCETRPTCHSCTTILPPAACTDDVTFFQPAICSVPYRPGTSAYPCPWWEMAVASEMMSPALARWV